MRKPENEIFESAFKEAFEKANLAPPDIVWENIEKALPQGAIGDSGGLAGNTVTMQTKLLIGTGIVLVTAITYLYLNSSLTNKYIDKLDPKNNETNITKLSESTNVDTELGTKELAFSPAFNTQKSNKIKEISSKISFNKNQDEKLETNLNSINTEIVELPQIQNILEGDFTEMKSINLKLPIIELELPSLEIISDSQNVVPYFETNTIGQPLIEKGKFWQNFKVRGGIRVSNQ